MYTKNTIKNSIIGWTTEIFNTLYAESTLPDTESIDPDTAMISPELIHLQNLLSWFEVRKSLEIMFVVQ